MGVEVVQVLRLSCPLVTDDPKGDQSLGSHAFLNFLTSHLASGYRWGVGGTTPILIPSHTPCRHLPAFLGPFRGSSRSSSQKPPNQPCELGVLVRTTG